MYRNIVTNSIQQTSPNLVRGGILADDMGLGKTLQIIALIISNPDGSPLLPNPKPPSSRYSSATLIVCPLSVIGNWTKQLGVRHVTLLKYYIYIGSYSRRYLVMECVPWDESS